MKVTRFSVWSGGRATVRATRELLAFLRPYRLWASRDADQILVVDGGAIGERGTHAELVAAGGGHYARLYAGQFGGESGR